MSAETLRKTAALMRERANEALASLPDTVPAWHSVPRLMEDGKTHGDAVHIATWHPTVALAVADWLDDVLREHDSGHGRYQLTGDPMGWTGEMRSALAVARAYLGREDTR